MNSDPRTKLVTVQHQLDHLTAVKAQLPPLREQLGEGLFQFDRLEARVNELDAQIRSLESVSFASIASTLTGTQRQKLETLQEEIAPLTQRYSAEIESLEALNEQVQAMEAELQDFRDIETEHAKLSDQVAERIMEEGGDTARQLAEIDADYQQIKAEHRTLGKAIDAAEQTEDHLDSMTRTLGKARTKMTTFRSPLGAVGQVAHQAFAHQQTKGPTRLVRQGVERLKRYLDELPLGDDTEINRELRQLSIALAEFATQLGGSLPAGFWCDMGVTLPIKQDVREALNHCTRLRNELQPQLEALQQQRQVVIDRTI